MTQSARDKDVVIIGAGLSGLGTALQLRSRGIPFILIEKERVYPDLFRAEKFNVSRVKLLEQLGISELRSPPAQSHQKIFVISKC